MLTPRLSARIGLSRSAAKARPHGERSSHHRQERQDDQRDEREVEERHGAAQFVAEQRRPRDAGDAERAAGDLFLVAHHEEHEHVESQRREGQVVMLHAQRGKAQRQPDGEAGDARDRQHDEDRPAHLEQDRRVVRADPEERRLAQRHLARVADGEVEAERGHQVDAGQREQVDLAALGEQRRDGDQYQPGRQQQGFALGAHTLRSSDLPSRPSGRNRITPRNRTRATPSL